MLNCLRGGSWGNTRSGGLYVSDRNFFVSSVFISYVGFRCLRPKPAANQILRGGSWASWFLVSLSRRSHDLASTGYVLHGFRCAR